jgi:hypothetical protein
MGGKVLANGSNAVSFDANVSDPSVSERGVRDEHYHQYIFVPT